jgi:plasmid stabilization system protein ParE
MKIVLKDTFLNRLEEQINYIATDNPTRAREFKNEVLEKVKAIPRFPYRCRKSIYFDEENIRDLVFRGFTIVYRITEARIEVFGFVKYKNTPHD